jgi:flagellar basal-body rod protein FlgB
VYLFEVASRHMTWLAERQMVTAANIANADTPGYRARDVADFSSYLSQSATGLSITSPLHIAAPAQDVSAPGIETGGSWGSAHSGNNVSLENELMTASRNNRSMNIDTGVMRSFHRMLLTSVKV